MNLSKISNHELVVRLEKLAGSERKITHLILWHINEMESRKLYAELGFSSMYDYMTRHLGYGESSAYRRIQSARLLKQIPHLAEKIENGSLNLTQLTQVQKCLKNETKAGNSVDISSTIQILEKIENQTNFETQKTLAVEFNQPVQVHEVMRPQQNESIRLELTLTQDQMKKLAHTKDLLSHILPDASWAEVITYLADKQITKIEGKVKAASILRDGIRSETQRFCSKQEREPIKITMRREIFSQAQKCCEYVDSKTGNQCRSTYQLQVDHIVPVALGGRTERENLRVLCRTHNLLSARQMGLALP